MSAPSSPELDALVSGVVNLNASKYFQLASFVMLVYDHSLTFDQEVERVWKQRISGASILFFINRYITVFQFIIILDAFHDPTWSDETCNKFVIFEGASTVALIAVCELIMILRVYALYGRSIWILIFLMVLWAVQIFISAYGLHRGFPVPLPPFLVGCILTGDHVLFPSIWVAPLITDTCIFVLTLFRTRQYIKASGTSPTLHVFVRDGALYFGVIFLANLMNALVYFLAPPDLKAIGASFSQLITAVMVSRLVLNLRSIPDKQQTRTHGMNDSFSPGTTGFGGFGYQRESFKESFMTRTIGNLGAEFDDDDDAAHGGSNRTATGELVGPPRPSNTSYELRAVQVTVTRHTEEDFPVGPGPVMV